MTAVLAFVALVAVLAAAVARWERVPDWAVAASAAVLLVLAGSISAAGARDALEDLGPTVGFDAAIVLLTPVVFTTAARLRFNPRPHVYACTHLANSASLLLPVSNLTNLLAFQASRLSFTRFAALMALPTLAAVAIEWLVLSRFFASDLDRPRARRPVAVQEQPLPRTALVVLGLTMAGFGLSSVLGVAPVWIAAAGAAAITVPALLSDRTEPGTLLRAAEPGFLVFVLGLGVIVACAAEHGLGDAVRVIVP